MGLMEQLPDHIRQYIAGKQPEAADGYVRFLQEEQITRLTGILGWIKDADRPADAFGQAGGAQIADAQVTGIPFAITAFADVLSWEDGYVMLHRLSEGDERVMLYGTDFLFQNLEDPAYQQDFFEMALYRQALQKCGRPGAEECFVLEPIPQLGGARELRYVSVGNLWNYISLLIC